MKIVSAALREPHIGRLLAVLTAMVWFTTMAAVGLIGEQALLVPLAAAGGLAIAGSLAWVSTGQAVAVATFQGFAVLVPNLSFREREIGTSGLDLQNGGKFATWAFMLAVAYANREILMRLLRSGSTPVWLVAFCCAALTSSAWSPVPAYSAACAVGCFAWLTFAAVVALRVSEDRFVATMLVALGTEVMTGVVVGFILPEVGWMAPSPEEAGFRLQGLSGHPNLLAQHAAIMLLFVGFAWDRRLLGWFSCAALAAMSIAAMIATNGRTTMVAVILAFAVFFVRRCNGMRPVLLVVTGGATCACLLAAVDALPTLESVFGGLSRTGSASEITTLTGRTDLWAIAWNHFLEKPLFGWGYNGTERLMADSVPTSFAGNAVNAHNMVLQGLMSLGVIGFFPMAVVIGTLLVRFVMRPDAMRDTVVTYAAALCIAEAELATVPGTLTFLVFWCVIRDALPADACAVKTCIRGAVA